MNQSFSLGMYQKQEMQFSPMLLRSLEIVQMNIQKLELEIHNELAINPFLEMEEEAYEETEENDEAKTETHEADEGEKLNDGFEHASDSDYDDTPLQSTLVSRESPDSDFSPLDVLSTPESVYDKMFRMIEMDCPDDDFMRVIRIILGYIDDKGFLAMAPEKIAEENSIAPDLCICALQIMKDSLPAGFGEIDLEHALVAQLHALEIDEPKLEKIILNDFEMLKKKNFQGLMQRYKLDRETLSRYFFVFSRLSPNPMQSLTDEPQVSAVQPDVYVKKYRDEFVVEINDTPLPVLRLNIKYHEIFKSLDKNHASYNFFYEKYYAARWILYSIEQRRLTLIKITNEIIKLQNEFFLKGRKYLKSLNIAEVAENVGFNEGTISRATKDKYLSTPFGVFSYKFFFPSGISGENGESSSSHVIQNKIVNLVENENKQKPLSDNKIADILGEQGIPISRRTVTKYRKKLGILNAFLRKEIL